MGAGGTLGGAVGCGQCGQGGGGSAGFDDGGGGSVGGGRGGGHAVRRLEEHITSTSSFVIVFATWMMMLHVLPCPSTCTDRKDAPDSVTRQLTARPIDTRAGMLPKNTVRVALPVQPLTGRASVYMIFSPHPSDVNEGSTGGVHR